MTTPSKPYLTKAKGKTHNRLIVERVHKSLEQMINRISWKEVVQYNGTMRGQYIISRSSQAFLGTWVHKSYEEMTELLMRLDNPTRGRKSVI